LNLLRLICTSGLALLIVGGYVASQVAVWKGNAESYAKQIDQPSIALLALVLLVAVIACGALFGKEDPA
jgi:hypothetical protein